MDAVEPVAGEEERAESGGEGEVGEGGYVVVGEVDGVLVLQQLLFSGPCLSTVFRTHREGREGEKEREGKVREGGKTNLCNAQILNRGYFVSCSPPL